MIQPNNRNPTRQSVALAVLLTLATFGHAHNPSTDMLLIQLQRGASTLDQDLTQAVLSADAHAGIRARVSQACNPLKIRSHSLTSPLDAKALERLQSAINGTRARQKRIDQVAIDRVCALGRAQGVPWVFVISDWRIDQESCHIEGALFDTGGILVRYLNVDLPADEPLTSVSDLDDLVDATARELSFEIASLVF